MKTTSSEYIKEIKAQIRVINEALKREHLKECKKPKGYKKQQLIQESMINLRLKL